MGCLISGYFPEPVTVQWNGGAISTGFQNFPPVAHSSSSQLTVPAAKWRDEKFHCNVAHAPTSYNKPTPIPPCKKNEPVAPTIRMLHSPCKPRSSGATVELMCIISGFYPADVEVTWLENNEPKSLSPYTDHPWKDTNGYTFSTVSTINVTQSDWLEGASYACQVNHAAVSTPVKSQASICTDDNTGIRVYTQRPKPEDLYLMRNPPEVACIVVNLASSEGLAVTWSHEKEGTLNPEPQVIRDESNGTTTVISRLRISSKDWENGDIFTCKVEHAQELAFPIEKSISKETDNPIAPQVYLFHPHIEEINSGSHHVTITALVQGFKPSDISANWVKNGRILTDGDAVTPVLKDKEDTYFLVSKLQVPRSHWNRGDSYTFMAVHQGLSVKFIQKSIHKIQVIMISAEMDQSDDEIESLWTTILIFFILFLLSVCYNATAKWIFSAVMQLKASAGPEYKNVIEYKNV